MQTQPKPTIAALRDRLDWLSLEGTADALARNGGPKPPKGHRAERRAYMDGYINTLDAMRAYGEGRF